MKISVSTTMHWLKTVYRDTGSVLTVNKHWDDGTVCTIRCDDVGIDYVVSFTKNCAIMIWQRSPDGYRMISTENAPNYHSEYHELFS